ncbi:hypothetical protein RGT18_14330 [Solobacterium moorei]|nr:hypothetical protein RGT18_14330 [Solobacterium moorei]
MLRSSTVHPAPKRNGSNSGATFRIRWLINSLSLISHTSNFYIKIAYNQKDKKVDSIVTCINKTSKLRNMLLLLSNITYNIDIIFTYNYIYDNWTYLFFMHAYQIRKRGI